MKTLWKNFRMIEKTAVILLSLILLINILAPLIAPFDPNQIDVSIKLQDPSRIHWLGTDHLGRDILSRLMYGGRESILLAMVATILSMFLGMLIGVIVGYVGGITDSILSMITSMFQGIPSTCIMIAVVGIFQGGVRSLILALVITSWAGFSRIVRLEVLQVKNRVYVKSARHFGSGHLRLILCHLLPNIADNIIVLFAARTGQAILAISSMSFLGLGVKPPTPDWGCMVNDARSYFYQNVSLLLLPCACIFCVSWCINTIGEGLRHQLNSKRDMSKEI